MAKIHLSGRPLVVLGIHRLVFVQPHPPEWPQTSEQQRGHCKRQFRIAPANLSRLLRRASGLETVPQIGSFYATDLQVTDLALKHAVLFLVLTRNPYIRAISTASIKRALGGHSQTTLSGPGPISRYLRPWPGTVDLQRQSLLWTHALTEEPNYRRIAGGP